MANRYANREAAPNAVFDQGLVDRATGTAPIVGGTSYWRQYDQAHPFRPSGNVQQDLWKRQIRMSLEQRYPNGPPNGYQFDSNGTVSETLGRQIRNVGIAAIPLATLVTAGLLAPALAGGGAAAVGGTAAATGGAASTVVPAVTAAGFTAPSWLGPLLNTAIPVAGQIIGTNMAANANADAADMQSESARDALDFEKQAYGDLVGRLQPYLDAGQSSTERMVGLLGRPRDAFPATPRGGVAPPVTGAPVSGPAIPQPTPGRMVTLRSPSGTIRQVPEQQAAWYESKGATRIPDQAGAI